MKRFARIRNGKIISSTTNPLPGEVLPELKVKVPPHDPVTQKLRSKGFELILGEAFEIFETVDLNSEEGIESEEGVITSDPRFPSLVEIVDSLDNNQKRRDLVDRLNEIRGL